VLHGPLESVSYKIQRGYKKTQEKCMQISKPAKQKLFYNDVKLRFSNSITYNFAFIFSGELFFIFSTVLISPLNNAFLTPLPNCFVNQIQVILAIFAHFEAKFAQND
jgi:hypothetical protein